MTTYRDDYHLSAFKQAISVIAGEDDPPRRKLRDIGRELAKLAGRSRPWSGGHLYNLLHLHELPSLPERYGLHPQLFDAATKRAGMDVLNGAREVTVLTSHRVRPGAVVLAHSRRCARYRCGIHFVPKTPNQRYCCEECERRIAAFRRKRRKRLGRQKAR